jgi:hypothetical protein
MNDQQMIVEALTALWLAWLSTTLSGTRWLLLTVKTTTLAIAALNGFHAYARFMGWPV